MQLSAPILAEVVSGLAILLRILVRHQRIEHGQNFLTDLRHGGDGDDKDKVIATNMANETVTRADPAYDVMQDLRENPDDAIALEVAVAIVVFLEVIDVRVAHRELVPRRQTPRDLRFDLWRAGQPRRRVYVHVAIRATQHDVEPLHRLSGRRARQDDL